MGVLDKVRKFKNNRPSGGNRSKMRGIFHDWQDGPNEVRLVGEFLEVKTHFISPAPKRGDRGLCQNEAFAKENSKKISKVVNCPDWDIDKEEKKDKKTCPICMLYRLADQALKEEPDEKEEKYFKDLKSAARVRTNLKWNVFDRENSNVTVIDDKGNEAKQKGLKIATIGMEAWEDIEGIFEQCGFDITDAKEGVDIKVMKGHNGTRVSYSAQVVLEGTSVKVTPFDDEEQNIVDKPHDLKAICGKSTDADAIRDALHGDYAELLDLNEEDGTPAKEESVEESTQSAEESGEEDDDDALLGGTSQKKN